MCKIADIVVLIMLSLCSISDWKKKTIPVLLLAVMSVVVVGLVFISHDVSLRMRLGGTLMGIVFLLISKFTREALGYGDSWLILILSVYLGFLQAISILFVASLAAGVVSLFCLWKHHWSRKATLPFVPFLTIAYLEVFL